jgi:hypothetical protein
MALWSCAYNMNLLVHFEEILGAPLNLQHAVIRSKDLLMFAIGW